MGPLGPTQKITYLDFLKIVSKAPHSVEPAIALDLSFVIQKYQKLTAPFGFDFRGLGARFWKFSKRVLAVFSTVLAAKCVLGGVFGRLLGTFWSRLGAEDGPSNLQVKPNPIGFPWRLEGSLERHRSVLGASWCVLRQLPASHTKKDENIDPTLVPWNMIMP